MTPSLNPKSIVNTTARQSQRLVRSVTGEAVSIYQQARNRGRSEPKPDMDDVTLARKVETELFRPANAPKGSVDINVVEGVVYLRGEVKRPAQIKDLENRARQVPEVRDVENLLHLPKTPSPTRADSPKRVQKTPRSPKASPRRRTTATRTRTTAEAPGPATAPAAKGSGSEGTATELVSPGGPAETGAASGGGPQIGGGSEPDAPGFAPGATLQAEESAGGGTFQAEESAGGGTLKTGAPRAEPTATERTRTLAEEAGTTEPAGSAEGSGPGGEGENQTSEGGQP